MPRHHRLHGRQLQACVRPLGEHLAQRHRLLHDAWRSTRTRRAARSARNAMLVNRSTDGGRVLERPDHPDPRPRRAGPERQELDHRRPEQRQLRLRGLGPAAGLHSAAGGGGATPAGRVAAPDKSLMAGRRGPRARARVAVAAAGRPARQRARQPPAPVIFEGPVYLARTTNGG